MKLTIGDKQMDKKITLKNFRRLNLKKGDILFLSFDSNLHVDELKRNYEVLRDQMNIAGWKGVPLIILPFKTKIGVINKGKK